MVSLAGRMFVHAAILAKIPAGRTVHAFHLVSCQGLKVKRGYDEHSYMIDHASDGQSLKCGRIRRRFGNSRNASRCIWEFARERFSLCEFCANRISYLKYISTTIANQQCKPGPFQSGRRNFLATHQDYHCCPLR